MDRIYKKELKIKYYKSITERKFKRTAEEREREREREKEGKWEREKRRDKESEVVERRDR